ncbi:Flagellin N-terminal domain protein [Leptospira santarosai]|uniref:Flagellin N-terminal domain protein n=1 Tax=Leptospira santarosai TaxID=28183 RepID=A0A2P1QSD9_9LEPT|nr:Flagellin N-terminal domain protein [Leptospira santarosai]
MENLDRTRLVFIYSIVLFFLLTTYVSCNSFGKGRISKSSISFTEIAEARSFLERLEIYLQTISDLLQRNLVLAVKSSNGIYDQEDRNQLDVQFQELLKEICRIRESAHFENETLFDKPGNVSLQIDPHNYSILFPLPELEPENFGVSSCNSNDFKSKMSVKTALFAERSVYLTEKALSIVSWERSRITVLWDQLDQ